MKFFALIALLGFAQSLTLHQLSVEEPAAAPAAAPKDPSAPASQPAEANAIKAMLDPKEDNRTAAEKNRDHILNIANISATAIANNEK